MGVAYPILGSLRTCRNPHRQNEPRMRPHSKRRGAAAAETQAAEGSSKGSNPNVMASREERSR